MKTLANHSKALRMRTGCKTLPPRKIIVYTAAQMRFFMVLQPITMHAA